MTLEILEAKVTLLDRRVGILEAKQERQSADLIQIKDELAIIRSHQVALGHRMDKIETDIAAIKVGVDALPGIIARLIQEGKSAK